MTSSKHATLIDHLPGMAYRCLNDDYWTMLEVSSGATKVTGYQPEDLENNQRVRFADLIHPADRQRVWEEVQRGLNHKRGIGFVSVVASNPFLSMRKSSSDLWRAISLDRSKSGEL